MKKTVPIFTKATGLNNGIEPARLQYADGVCDLASAYNVDIDVSGRVSRRKGYTATILTVGIHSLYSDGINCLFVYDESLFRLNKDYSTTGIRSGLTVDQPMSYCTVNNNIYYANGMQIGYVVNNTSYVWTAASYVGPATSRVFVGPPVGHLVAYYNGRVYMIVNDVAYYSEPFAYNNFNYAQNFVQLTSRIRMFRAVKDGIYVGTNTGVMFLGGSNPKEFVLSSVSDSPVVAGTDTLVTNATLGLQQAVDEAVVWTAQDGIYAGLEGGKVINLTKNRLVYGESQIGCAVFDKKTNRYISLIQ